MYIERHYSANLGGKGGRCNIPGKLSDGRKRREARGVRHECSVLILGSFSHHEAAYSARTIHIEKSVTEPWSVLRSIFLIEIWRPLVIPSLALFIQARNRTFQILQSY